MSSCAAATSRAMSDADTKHGVSDSRNSIGTPQRVSSSATNVAYLACENARLNRWRWTGITNQFNRSKSAFLHDLLVVHPDVEFGADDVDVGRRPPACAGVCAVKAYEKAMCTPGNFSSCRMCPMTDLSSMLVPMANSPTRSLFSSVWVYRQKSSRSAWLSECASTTALAHGNRERRVLERAVPIAEPVADDAVDDERAVHVSGGGKDLAARQVAPLFREIRPLVLIHFRSGSRSARMSLPAASSRGSSGRAGRCRRRGSSGDRRRGNRPACRRA